MEVERLKEIRRERLRLRRQMRAARLRGDERAAHRARLLEQILIGEKAAIVLRMGDAA